jgi:hypothetical protein
MKPVLVYLIGFGFMTVLWVVTVVAYSRIIGDFDFGTLASFLIKSLILVAIASLTFFIPSVRVAMLMALGIWWIGVVVLFGMDSWEAKMLVILAWGFNVALRMGLAAVLA